MDVGNKIFGIYKEQEIEGTLIQEQDGILTIKLASGYNVLLPKDELDVKSVKPIVSTKEKVHPIKQDHNLPKVSILHTGGTIASKVDYATGAVHTQFTPEELLALFPEASTIANLTSRLVRNMWSQDIRFAHYNIMAHAVFEEQKKGATGVIVTHGTDTLHYSAAALSFALKGITIPVVLVGAQRSSDRGSSDAATNVFGALRFITTVQAPGVFVAMHETSADTSIAILDGLHVRKNHASRRNAFIPVNGTIVARVTDTVEIVDKDRLARWKANTDENWSVKPFNDRLRIGIWKTHTQSFADELTPYHSFDGLIIEGTGLGHIPMDTIDEFTTEHEQIFAKVKELAQRIPVAITTQTVFGRINLNVYSPQRLLQEIGVLGNNCDMPTEVAFIKLAWLLSNYTTDEAKKLYSQDMLGEISQRSPLEDWH